VSGRKSGDRQSNYKLISYFEASLIKPFEELWNRLNKTADAIGTACLFDDTLMVNIYGKFLPCENMPHQLEIGDFENGYKWNKIATLINKFTETRMKTCDSCNVKHLCTPCYIHFLKNDSFSINEEYCSKQKKWIYEGLKLYVKENM